MRHEEKTFYEEMKDAGLVTGSHYSDLYTKACPEALDIAKRHGVEGATSFINQVSGERNYEFPCCFDPYWAKRLKSV